jgi:hypothetical protein
MVGFLGGTATAGNPVIVQSPVAGRPDFERLEMEGQAGLANILREPEKNGWI